VIPAQDHGGALEVGDLGEAFEQLVDRMRLRELGDPRFKVAAASAGPVGLVAHGLQRRVVGPPWHPPANSGRTSGAGASSHGPSRPGALPARRRATRRGAHHDAEAVVLDLLAKLQAQGYDARLDRRAP
jgi:hypothetical protein